jgi:hypothetical protein
MTYLLLTLFNVIDSFPIRILLTPLSYMPGYWGLLSFMIPFLCTARKALLSTADIVQTYPGTLAPLWIPTQWGVYLFCGINAVVGTVAPPVLLYQAGKRGEAGKWDDYRKFHIAGWCTWGIVMTLMGIAYAYYSFIVGTNMRVIAARQKDESLMPPANTTDRYDPSIEESNICARSRAASRALTLAMSVASSMHVIDMEDTSYQYSLPSTPQRPHMIRSNSGEPYRNINTHEGSVLTPVYGTPRTYRSPSLARHASPPVVLVNGTSLPTVDAPKDISTEPPSRSSTELAQPRTDEQAMARYRIACELYKSMIQWNITNIGAGIPAFLWAFLHWPAISNIVTDIIAALIIIVLFWPTLLFLAMLRIRRLAKMQ